ncbi:Acetyltransferase (GNAT) domain-containing protein [Methylophilus rhizosphaerae]|uniref:Acetyltransferase (GNAT) domain-containing protein n=1 Tax=Methylophilus rhizosphaerae TaxID=492660 RepID=A0A1G9A9P8_9PROT|nr:GNAT family N-acetyltransferase [Methylophilus rhizosphaerae]SDK23993.1 Acetyltransferase (GNAT) domain-containing protein [Methylophilus rhizosphaerae]
MNMIADGFLKELNKQKTDIDLTEIDLHETSDVNENNEWMIKFKNDYAYKTNSFSKHILLLNMHKQTAYLIKYKNKTIGYIRLIKRGKVFKAENVLSLDCVYIDKEYRKQGIYKHVIQELNKYFNVYLIHIEKNEALKHYKFFNSLGFYCGFNKNYNEYNGYYLYHKNIKLEGGV